MMTAAPGAERATVGPCPVWADADPAQTSAADVLRSVQVEEESPAAPQPTADQPETTTETPAAPEPESTPDAPQTTNQP